MVTALLTEERVRAALAEVKDPEIPTCSIVDLGIVERIAIGADAIEVDLLPTFAGCPALDVIKFDVERAIEVLGAQPRVRFVMSPPWTTDRLTPAGIEAFARIGIAGPVLQIGSKPAPVACPYCGSTATELESNFGPSPCRTIRYCNACRNPFEGFKTK
jgi:ring-1,2-phenylacetyl-CoA epoxidase subunit PaaD